MGKLADFKNNNPDVFKTQATSNSGTPQEKENMPIKVTGYELGGTLDTNFIVGERIDTKEIVKVRLEEIEQSSSSKYKRIEISDFANKSSRKHYVKEGCPMVFENAKRSPDGSYVARWAVVLDRDPDGTKVIVMNSSLRSGTREKDGVKQEWFQIQALIPSQPKQVTSQEEFDTLVAKQLKPNFSGSNPQTFVRIKDEDGETLVIDLKPLRVEVEEDGKKYKRAASEGLDSLNHFKNTNPEQYDMIMSFVTDTDVSVELIPGATLYPGTATKEKMEAMHKSTKQILLGSFHVKEDNEDSEEGEENRFPKIGFLPCVLATRMYPDGTPYLTYIRPLKLFDTALSIEDIEKVTVK